MSFPRLFGGPGTFPFSGTPGDDSGDAYRVVWCAMFLKLLPRGDAWQRSADSWLGKLLCGLSSEYAALAESIDVLRHFDAYPDTAINSLSDWERFAGVPTDATLSDEVRRLIVVGKIVYAADNSEAALRRLAEAMGYTLGAINLLPPSMAGWQQAGYPMLGTFGWAYTREVIYTPSGTPADDEAMRRALLNWVRSHGWLTFREAGDDPYTWQPSPSGVNTQYGDDIVTVTPIAPAAP